MHPLPTHHAWTEAALQALGPDEYDFQEFKGAGLIHRDGVVLSEFQIHLSKQLSAFANGGGGRIFLGVDDSGRVDGGVPIDLRRGGTRSWLEDIIPGSVDPPLPAFNVHEVLPDGPDSAIHPGCAVYVIEVPSSESAPHQSLDHRYYLRIAGKSRPMGHVHLADVLRRTRHPRLDVTRVDPYGPGERITTDPRGPKVMLCFRVQGRNDGPRLAQHAGIELVLPRALVNRDVRRRMQEEAGATIDQRPGSVSFFRHHPHPIFPSQSVQLLTVWLAVHGGNLDAIVSGQARFAWKVYADDAPARAGSRPVNDTAVVKDAIRWVRQQLPAASRGRSRKPIDSQ